MDVSLEEQGSVARAFLDGLVREMDLEADIVVVHPDEDTIEVNLEGADLGVLIGPKGATLFALQDLTRTVVQRKTSASNGRLLVDVSSYRQKRKAALERFARQLAEEVRDSGTRKVLEPMNASDRKVVHDTVNEIDGVATTSEGEDPNRRVVILPAQGLPAAGSCQNRKRGELAGGSRKHPASPKTRPCLRCSTRPETWAFSVLVPSNLSSITAGPSQRWRQNRRARPWTWAAGAAFPGWSWPGFGRRRTGCWSRRDVAGPPS